MRNHPQRGIFPFCVVVVTALTATAAPADRGPDALLRRVAHAYRSARTLSARVSMVQRDQGRTARITGSAKLKKPNLARFRSSVPQFASIVSDGKTVWRFVKAGNAYTRSAADPKGRMLLPFPILTLFFDPRPAEMLGPRATVRTRLLRRRYWRGRSFRVVEIRTRKPPLRRVRLYVGRDRLIHRMTLARPGICTEFTISGVRVNRPMARASFAFHPPKGARAFQGMLAPGDKAPAFDLPTRTGGRVTLAGVLRNRKAALLSFWYGAVSDASPFGARMRKEHLSGLQAMHARLGSKGLGVVSIVSGDSADAIRDYMARNGFTFTVGLDSGPGGARGRVFEQYGVTAGPTDYLLGANGTVVSAAIGVSTPKTRAAVDRLGIR